MAQIKILDKEKDYLLTVNPYQFVDSLDSKSIFYELLSFDRLNNKSKLNIEVLMYNNISLVGIYTALLNLIFCNLYEGLVFRHHIIYKKEHKEYNLSNFSINIKCINYIDKTIFECMTQIINPHQEFEYNFGNIFYGSWLSNTKVEDTIRMSYGLNIFEHEITLWKKDIAEDFLSKMLILYQDFAGAIPI
jgi:hypothetical protein